MNSDKHIQYFFTYLIWPDDNCIYVVYFFLIHQAVVKAVTSSYTRDFGLYVHNTEVSRDLKPDSDKVSQNYISNDFVLQITSR